MYQAKLPKIKQNHLKSSKIRVEIKHNQLIGSMVCMSHRRHYNRHLQPLHVVYTTHSQQGMVLVAIHVYWLAISKM